MSLPLSQSRSGVRRPLPLNPKSADVEVISGPVCDLLRLACRGSLDGLLSASPAIPKPVSFSWAGMDVPCNDVGWAVDRGSLKLEVRQGGFVGEEDLDAKFGVMNEPAEFTLDGNARLSAPLGHLCSRGHSIDLTKRRATSSFGFEFDSWTWWPPDHACLWVGQLERAPVEDGNLVVCGDTWWSGRNLLLRGTYDLYLVASKKRTTKLVVDTHGSALDQSVLGTCFMAIQFALGRSLRLDQVLALNHDMRVVGAAGLELGAVVMAEGLTRCPVAGSRDLYADSGERVAEDLWIPVLFSKLAHALHQEGLDSPLTTAVGAYVDSLTTGNIHASYLLLQVALEALCAGTKVQSSGTLVADAKRWLAFVDKHENEIRSFAANEDAARKLVHKVRNAQQAPSGERVASAFRHLGLSVPEQALAEVARRNSSVHSFVMAKESTTDAQNLADRLAIVQTLLVTVVAKLVQFDGPIVGWRWIDGRRDIPEWWPWKKRDEARRQYLVLPDGEADEAGGSLAPIKKIGSDEGG